MAKVSLPKLTEAQIHKLATAQSFERGQRYFKDGAVIEPVLQGDELRAECAGSEYEPYELSVTFDKKGVAEMDCSCPYDRGSACKHLVALLLTCAHKPQVVRRLDSLDSIWWSTGSKERILPPVLGCRRKLKRLLAKQSDRRSPRSGMRTRKTELSHSDLTAI
jgi:SWIM zinc finger